MENTNLLNEAEPEKKKPSKLKVIVGLITLLLGIVGAFAAMGARKMRKGTALLFEDARLVEWYKYYPLLLGISLVLIVLGIILLYKKKKKV